MIVSAHAPLITFFQLYFEYFLKGEACRGQGAGVPEGILRGQDAGGRAPGEECPGGQATHQAAATRQGRGRRLHGAREDDHLQVGLEYPLS